MGVAEPIIEDLQNESDALDALVDQLSAEQWALPTPAPGWTIAHQIGHLLWTDRVALTSVTDEAAFLDVVAAAAPRATTFVDDGAEEAAAVPPAELLADWRSTRGALHAALRRVPDGRKLLWFGPPMSGASMATARLMETWAHGLDVADALGITVAPTPRLKSIAHLGVRTRDFAFTVHGLTPPAEPFRVELAAPDGGVWAWGPEDAAQRVRGSALAFCYLVTQRRPRAELDVVAEGPDAQKWLTIAQAFAGPPGVGR
jgi:uncharacterized protein (TIGR03084 family)